MAPVEHNAAVPCCSLWGDRVARREGPGAAGGTCCPGSQGTRPQGSQCWSHTRAHPHTPPAVRAPRSHTLVRVNRSLLLLGRAGRRGRLLYEEREEHHHHDARAEQEHLLQGVPAERRARHGRVCWPCQAHRAAARPGPLTTGRLPPGGRAAHSPGRCRESPPR